jgi:hypothetical protein
MLELFAVPMMDVRRARDQLGRRPAHSAGDALLELVGGMREGAGADTPPLRPSGASGRVGESKHRRRSRRPAATGRGAVGRSA